MILIGLGANLDSPRFGAPRATCEAALAELAARGVGVVRRSPWYRSAPVPASGQPWFVNGVARVETPNAPERLLVLLHEVEAAAGRVRTVTDAARCLDLDLLDYDGRVQAGPPVLPHPRLHLRRFVLRPLADVAPEWRHPASGRSVSELLAAAPEDQVVERLGD